MNVARTVFELEHTERSVAIGTFDGVHLGHRRVIEEALAGKGRTTVVTFDPHPRIALGYGVELLTTLERRLELFAELGVEETLVLEFTAALSRQHASDFVDAVLRPIGAQRVVAGETFRFGHRREGDMPLLRELGCDAQAVPLLPGVSSTLIRELVRAGEVDRAAALLNRPVEVEGTVVGGDARGGTLGFPTANLAVPAHLLVPAFGIYAGAARGTRAATSIGLNPHYGGRERRVESFLVDFDGDLYGQRLVVELWSRLRDEQAFASEEELVAQIARDVEQTCAATRPV